jgi:hypothetical protein
MRIDGYEDKIIIASFGSRNILLCNLRIRQSECSKTYGREHTIRDDNSFRNRDVKEDLAKQETVSKVFSVFCERNFTVF